MDLKIVCVNPKCKMELQRPNSAFIKCPSCGTDFFVFCHQFPFRLFEHVQCKKCPNELYYFFCFKCTGLMNFVKYRMGSVSSCKCGFNGCYVICDKCKKPECFPPDRRYEGIAWKCNFCNNPFNFMTCDQCFHEIYDSAFTVGQNITCKNAGCRSYLTVKNCDRCKFIFIDSRGRSQCEPCYQEEKKKPSNPTTNNPPIDPLKKKPSDQKGMTPPAPTKHMSTAKIPQNLQCKVCLDKQADYINTKCFHMSVCEVCVRSMKDTCPICRATGQFRKVFK